MGYHDTRLHETFSAGSLFGPGYKTSIIELDSGAESRIQRGQPAGRRNYSLERGIANLSDLQLLYEFYLARQGALNSFRLKDWLDYATTPSRTTHQPTDATVSHTDEDLVLISGKTYQLVSRYVSGSQTIVRTIHKPVSGTVVVGDDGSLVDPGDYTIDYQTGQITFDSGYTINGDVTGGCEFDVVVRFAEETDEAMMIAIEAVTVGSLPAIRCVEDIQPVQVSQDFPFGGAYNHGDPAANISLSELNGRLQIAGPTTTGKKFILPATTDLPLGGPYFMLYNEGSEDMEVETSGGTDVVNPLEPDVPKTIWLGLASDGTTKTWYAT